MSSDLLADDLRTLRTIYNLELIGKPDARMESSDLPSADRPATMSPLPVVALAAELWPCPDLMNSLQRLERRGWVRLFVNSSIRYAAWRRADGRLAEARPFKDDRGVMSYAGWIDGEWISADWLRPIRDWRIKDGEPRPIYTDGPYTVRVVEILPTGVEVVERETAATAPQILPARHDEDREPDGPTLTWTGKAWRLAYPNGDEIERASLPDVAGVRYIAHLLANPARAFTAAELEQDARPADDRRGARASGDARDGFTCETAQPVADREALRQIHDELAEIAADLERPDLPDCERHELEDKRDRIRDLVKRDTGIAGRLRNFEDAAEKARKRVTAAITRAIKKIRPAAPAFARHLDCISTGQIIQYNPPEPIAWTVAA